MPQHDTYDLAQEKDEEPALISEYIVAWVVTTVSSDKSRCENDKKCSRTDFAPNPRRETQRFPSCEVPKSSLHGEIASSFKFFGRC